MKNGLLGTASEKFSNIKEKIAEAAKKPKNRKTAIIVICAALVLAGTVFGTIAFFTHTTDDVKNTFTMGKLLDDPLSFVLKEHKALDEDEDGAYTLSKTEEVSENTYLVLPGVDIPKDPFVKTEETLKLDAYVFIEVKDATEGTNLHYTVDAQNWTLLTGKTGPKGGKVYVMALNGGIVNKDSKLGPVSILKDNKVTVDNAAITDAEKQFGGEVSFYGYMIQAGSFKDYEEAWKGFAGEKN